MIASQILAISDRIVNVLIGIVCLLSSRRWRLSRLVIAVLMMLFHLVLLVLFFLIRFGSGQVVRRLWLESG